MTRIEMLFNPFQFKQHSLIIQPVLGRKERLDYKIHKHNFCNIFIGLHDALNCFPAGNGKAVDHLFLAGLPTPKKTKTNSNFGVKRIVVTVACFPL